MTISNIVINDETCISIHCTNHYWSSFQINKLYKFVWLCLFIYTTLIIKIQYIYIKFPACFSIINVFEFSIGFTWVYVSIYREIILSKDKINFSKIKKPCIGLIIISLNVIFSIE